MNRIDKCAECGGQLRIVSLNRDERIRRRCGQSMIAKCSRCGVEVAVVKKAWLLFAHEQWQAKRDRAREKMRQTDEYRQPSLFT